MSADCLAHWHAHDLPLVVTRQPLMHDAESIEAPLHVGLPAPLRWGRHRIALALPRACVSRLGRFPEVRSLSSAPACDAMAPVWRRLDAIASTLGATIRVQGSHGWAVISGLECVRACSDVDLIVEVKSVREADAVSDALVAMNRSTGARHADGAGPHLDGELVFDEEFAFSWAEWHRWRRGGSRSVLMKRTASVSMLWDVEDLARLRDNVSTVRHEGACA